MSFGSEHLRDARIVVIGAGAVGAAVSYRLAQAGADVTIVERRYPGSGTSGNSFAWLNGFNKRPRHYQRLNVMSIRDHQDLADELDGDWVLVGGGLHWAYESDTVKMDKLREIVRRLRDWGMRVDQTTPEIAMRELEPDLWIDPETVPEVYVIPREGSLDPVSMTHAVTRAAVSRYGARLERATVTGLRGPSGAVSSVVLDDGRELAADVVVNAAGPDAARIGELAGITIPLDRQIGLLVTTAPAPVRLGRVVHAPEINARPEGGARVMIHHEGMDHHAVEGERTPLDAPVVREAMDRARIVMPGLRDVSAEAVRIGVRPMPRDGHPIVGFWPSVSGLYVVVTHSGITLSARLGLLVAEELAGGDASELEPYRPSRFSEAAQGAPLSRT